MTGMVDVEDTLRQTFASEFAPAQPTFNIYYENQRRDNDDGEHWVQFNIMMGPLRRADLGSNKNFRQFGAVVVQVMAPENTGTRTSKGIADSVALILTDRIVSITGGGQIVLYGVDVSNRGIINGWHSYAVQCEFRADYQIIR